MKTKYHGLISLLVPLASRLCSSSQVFLSASLARCAQNYPRTIAFFARCLSPRLCFSSPASLLQLSLLICLPCRLVFASRLCLAFSPRLSSHDKTNFNYIFTNMSMSKYYFVTVQIAKEQYGKHEYTYWNEYPYSISHLIADKCTTQIFLFYSEKIAQW